MVGGPVDLITGVLGMSILATLYDVFQVVYSFPRIVTRFPAVFNVIESILKEPK